MHELIFFLIGCLLGGTIGVTVMCLVQINHNQDDYSQRKEDENEKNN